MRQVCSCRLPWGLFAQLRPAAKRLQHDPSPLVRANALHVEEDAKEIAALETLQEWIAEREPSGIAHRSNDDRPPWSGSQKGRRR
jgi:hypothetical protein